MQVLFAEIRDFFHDFCPAVRQMLRYGIPFAAGMYLAAGCIQLLLGVCGNFDKMLRVQKELLLCGSELFAGLLFGALCIQLLYIAMRMQKP